MGPSICRCCGSEIWRESKANPNLCAICADQGEEGSIEAGDSSSLQDAAIIFETRFERNGAVPPMASVPPED